LSTLLLTTPVQELNSSEDNILFLGEWCKLYPEYKYSQIVEIHKYHWDDRDKFTKDCNYLNDLYEKYLLDFSSILNKFHNRNEDTRYWRIIIGPWLKYFIDVIFDRFECIRTLGDKKIDNTYVFKYNLEDLIPDDFSCFYDQIRSDGWNHAIFSECIIYFGINHTLLNYSPYRSNISSKNSKQKLKNKLLNIYNSVFPRIFNSIAIIEPYTDIYQTIKLNIALGQFPIFGTNANERNINKLDKFRSEFISNNSLTSPFEYFLEKLIFKLIPFSYLENLATIEKSSLSKYPLNPKLIFTSNAYQANDLFKIWAANFVTNGIPLIIAQHGGHYGIGLVNQTEVHQLKISSVFASWGWGNAESIATMPSLKLNNSFTFKYKRNGKILITTPSYPRYFYCSFSVPLSGQFLYYLNDLFVFLNGINEKKNILIRTDADIFGWNIHKRIVDNNFGWAIDIKNIKLIDSLKESKIAISTYNATIFLETLSMNFPTLVYFDFKYYEIREDAQESISILLDANILHKSAVNAYQFLNSLNGEIESWWFSNSVQNARLVFCNKFARASSNCINEWKIFLNNNKNG
jgi:putative transferase (TIGR04331 family)